MLSMAKKNKLPIISTSQVPGFYAKRMISELKSLYEMTMLADLRNNISFVFDVDLSRLYVEYIGFKGTDFENGQYFIILDIPKEYPAKRPTLKIITESGRFDTKSNIYYTLDSFKSLNIISIDINDIHHGWTPILNLSQLIIMIIDSFSDYGPYRIGCYKKTKCDSKTNKMFAIKSRDYNKNYNSDLVNIFEEIRKLKISNDYNAIHEYIRININDAINKLSS